MAHLGQTFIELLGMHNIWPVGHMQPIDIFDHVAHGISLSSLPQKVAQGTLSAEKLYRE